MRQVWQDTLIQSHLIHPWFWHSAFPPDSSPSFRWIYFSLPQTGPPSSVHVLITEIKTPIIFWVHHGLIAEHGFFGFFGFFFSSENNHSLEQPLQELDRLLVIETFQDTIGLLDNLIQAVILMKVWSGWSLVLPSSLGCCMVLCFCESKFRGAGMGSDLGSTRFYVTAVLGLKPCFFVVSYSKSALNRA